MTSPTEDIVARLPLLTCHACHQSYGKALPACPRCRAGNDPSNDLDDPDPAGHLLGLRPVGEIAREVDAMPAPTWLFSPVFPSDAHGVLGAAWKAGKSWMMLDAAVSVASGTPWLGLFPVQKSGSVVIFLGEGGKRKMTRRGRAVAKARGLDWDDLPIVLSERVPKLAVEAQVNALALELARHPAVLVIIDPLYLAAAGAKGSQLYDMATVLEPVQVTCQTADAALILAHHNNRDTSRKNSDRMSGAGPAEWGRVLVSVEVVTSAEDQDTGRTDVVLKLVFEGDEITGGTHTVRRSVWADDKDDLGSALNYLVEQVADPRERATTTAWDGPTECMGAVAMFFREHAAGSELSKNTVATRLRALGLSYRNDTIGIALERLAIDSVLTVRDGPRNARMFSLPTTERDPDAMF